MDLSSVKRLVEQGRGDEVSVPESEPVEEGLIVEVEIGQVGRLLGQERNRLGLRHADVEGKAEVDSSFLSRVENDAAAANPTLATLRSIAGALSKQLVCRLVDSPASLARPEPVRSQGQARSLAVDGFVEWLNAPAYEMAYSELARERADEVAEKYFPRIRELAEVEVRTLLSVMRRSIEANQDHGHVNDWAQCCQGVADYLLRPGDLDGLHRLVAAEAVIRLSGYVHHGAELYARFRGTAKTIAETIWIRHGVDLHYWQIPEPWTSTVPDEDEEGYLLLWDFAGRQRALASRILCFICLHGYRGVYTVEEEHRELERRYLRNRNVLMRWSVTSEYVDEVAGMLVVHRQHLTDFLTRNRFNQSQMYKPGAAVREQWFKTWKHSLPETSSG